MTERRMLYTIIVSVQEGGYLDNVEHLTPYLKNVLEPLIHIEDDVIRGIPGHGGIMTDAWTEE